MPTPKINLLPNEGTIAHLQCRLRIISQLLNNIRSRPLFENSVLLKTAETTLTNYRKEAVGIIDTSTKETEQMTAAKIRIFIRRLDRELKNSFFRLTNEVIERMPPTMLCGGKRTRKACRKNRKAYRQRKSRR